MCLLCVCECVRACVFTIPIIYALGSACIQGSDNFVMLILDLFSQLAT